MNKKLRCDENNFLFNFKNYNQMQFPHFNPNINYPNPTQGQYQYNSHYKQPYHDIMRPYMMPVFDQATGENHGFNYNYGFNYPYMPPQPQGIFYDEMRVDYVNITPVYKNQKIINHE